jgi:hypothetical protein
MSRNSEQNNPYEPPLGSEGSLLSPIEPSETLPEGYVAPPTGEFLGHPS